MRVRYKNTPFLVEVIVNVLVFSIACSILAGAFAKASLLVRQTREESLANIHVSRLLETIKVRGTENIPGATHEEDGSLFFEYDDKWALTETGKGTFTIRIECSTDEKTSGALWRISAVARRAQDQLELCTISTSIYKPQAGAKQP